MDFDQRYSLGDSGSRRQVPGQRHVLSGGGCSSRKTAGNQRDRERSIFGHRTGGYTVRRANEVEQYDDRGRARSTPLGSYLPKQLQEGLCAGRSSTRDRTTGSENCGGLDEQLHAGAGRRWGSGRVGRAAGEHERPSQRGRPGGRYLASSQRPKSASSDGKEGKRRIGQKKAQGEGEEEQRTSEQGSGQNYGGAFQGYWAGQKRPHQQVCEERQAQEAEERKHPQRQVYIKQQPAERNRSIGIWGGGQDTESCKDMPRRVDKDGFARGPPPTVGIDGGNRRTRGRESTVRPVLAAKSSATHEPCPQQRKFDSGLCVGRTFAGQGSFGRRCAVPEAEVFGKPELRGALEHLPEARSRARRRRELSRQGGGQNSQPREQGGVPNTVDGFLALRENGLPECYWQGRLVERKSNIEGRTGGGQRQGQRQRKEGQIRGKGGACGQGTLR